MTRSGFLFALFGALLLLCVAFLGVALGSVDIPLADTLRLLTGGGQDLPDSWKTIILRIRLPRVVAAILVGGILAVGGAACQGLFRNPLAEPYLLGISSGAGLGATIAVVFGSTVGASALGVIGTAAFLGAFVVTFLVFLAAGRQAFRLPATLLLAGVAIAFLCNSAIWLFMTLNKDKVERILFWTMGSLASAGWTKVLWLTLTTLPVSILILLSGRTLDLLSIGYDGAYGLGLNPQRMGMVILGLTSLGTASAVAVSGTIGFVGLIVPHVVRLLGGPSHRSLVARSWLGGAVLLCLADIGARTLGGVGEIPVGVITSLLGGPFILILLRSQRREGRLDG